MNSFAIFDNLDIAQASRTQLEELLVYIRYLLVRESSPEKIEWLTNKQNEFQNQLQKLEYNSYPSSRSLIPSNQIADRISGK